MSKAATVYLVGSIVTLAVAAWLWKRGQRLAAGALIEASPFPCPPGLPC